jgi:hypothetical protein
LADSGFWSMPVFETIDPHHVMMGEPGWMFEGEKERSYHVVCRGTSSLAGNPGTKSSDRRWMAHTLSAENSGVAYHSRFVQRRVGLFFLYFETLLLFLLS